MKRREFLKLSASTLIVPSFGLAKPSRNFGWIPSGPASMPSFYQVSQSKGIGEGKVALLWKEYERTVGPWIAHKQASGDCVAHAAGSVLDLLSMMQGDRWVAASSTDMIYAGGRSLQRKVPSYGMRAEWTVEWLEEFGNLLRIEYPPYDLMPYSAKTNKSWDRKGVPSLLKKKAKEHPLLGWARVRSWEEARDAVVARSPIVLCAPFGAEDSRRDADGFIKPRGQWYHSWTLAGINDGSRPGALLLNSHGPNWGTGPKRHGQPDGSCWIDAKYIDSACRNFGDSYALSEYKGFPTRERKYHIW